MNTVRFTSIFTEEAARKIVDRGYPVSGVAERLDVFAHSLYKWVKALQPHKSQEQAAELVPVNSEIVKLRAQLHRVEGKRDMPKNGRSVLGSGIRVKYRLSQYRG